MHFIPTKCSIIQTLSRYTAFQDANEWEKLPSSLLIVLISSKNLSLVFLKGHFNKQGGKNKSNQFLKPTDQNNPKTIVKSQEVWQAPAHWNVPLICFVTPFFYIDVLIYSLRFFYILL